MTKTFSTFKQNKNRSAELRGCANLIRMALFTWQCVRRNVKRKTCHRAYLPTHVNKPRQCLNVCRSVMCEMFMCRAFRQATRDEIQIFHSRGASNTSRKCRPRLRACLFRMTPGVDSNYLTR